MRLVRAVSAGTGCSIASGRSASSSSSRRPYAASTFARQPRGRLRGAARRARVDGPDRLEAAIEVVRACGLDRARLLPGQQARRVAGGVDDHRPLVRERLALGDRHLHRSARRPPQRREVGEDGGRVGVARHPPPARLERAIEALALEGAEEHRRGRAGEQLVLDRARQRHQRRLAQHLRPAPWSVAATAAKIDGWSDVAPVSRARSSAALTDSPRPRWARARRSVSTSSGS